MRQLGPGQRLRVQASIFVHAPAALVRDVFADYAGWPGVFPTISAVQLRERRGATLVLEVQHVEGRVLNELTVTDEHTIELYEVKQRYDVTFVNRFDPVPEGTRYTVRGDFAFKGVARLVARFLGWYVRRQLIRLTLRPVQEAAERRVAE